LNRGEHLAAKLRYCTRCGAPTPLSKLTASRAFHFGAIVGFIYGVIGAIYDYLISGVYVAIVQAGLTEQQPKPLLA